MFCRHASTTESTLRYLAIAMTVCALSLDAAAQRNTADDQAAAIVQAAHAEAARIVAEATRRAAEIEAEAIRAAARIEADALRDTLPAPVASVPPQEPEPAQAVFPNIAGRWTWVGAGKNKRFKLEIDDDGAVTTTLYRSPLTKFYKEVITYEGGRLHGTIRIQTQNRTGKRDKVAKTFDLVISADGDTLKGTRTVFDEDRKSTDVVDVTWRRIK